jgi:hypothetical protein
LTVSCVSDKVKLWKKLKKRIRALSRLSPAEQVIAEKTVCVLLVRGENPDGKPIFAYVAVRADKLENFMEAQKTGMFYPEDYGVIIEAGEGEPSDDIKKKMETEYGFNHQMMMDIPDAEQAHSIASNLSENKQSNQS